MGHHDDGAAVFAVQAVEQFHDLGTHLRVKVARGLVGQEDFRVADDGSGDGHALALSAGELRGAVLHAVGEADALDDLLGQPLSLAAAHTTVDERQLHVVNHVERRDEVERLEDEAQRLVAQFGEAIVRKLRVDARAAQLNLAARRLVQQSHDVQQRRLAAARGAHDAQELALADFEVHILQRLCLHFVGNDLLFRFLLLP